MQMLNLRDVFSVGRYLLACMAFGAALPCTAATWYVFSEAIGKDALFYFDADSVLKQGPVITVWIKSVQIRVPKKSGDWAAAQRNTYNCVARTMEIKAYAMYDEAGKLTSSGSGAGSNITDILPDSVGEGILKGVCSRDFPLAKSDLYEPVVGNDIIGFTKSYREIVEMKARGKLK